jgi:hypothetical protein
VLIAVILLNTSCNQKRANITSNINTLVISKELVKTLPSGWSLTQNANIIKLVKNNKVRQYGHISLPHHDREGLLKEGYVKEYGYEITIRLISKLSDQQLSQIKKQNNESNRKLRLMGPKMSHFSMKGEFYPKSKEDKKLFNEYKLIESKIEPIPDLSSSEYSIFISKNLNRYYTSFYDKEVEEECSKLLNKLKIEIKNL